MRSDHRYGHKHKWYEALADLIWIVLLLCACLAAGYGLSYLLFRVTGEPVGLISHIISSFLGLIIMVIVIGVSMKIYYAIRGQKVNMHNGAYMKMMENTIEALERIARGDFSAIVPIDDPSPFSELAESVNKMARELGSMENLRQDFISNVSHEIQSPLTSISGFAALLKKESLTKDQRAHYIEVIETEAKRLSKLSDNLLKLSSLENNTHPLHKTAITLDRQIQSAVLMLEPQWTEKNISPSLSLEKVDYHGDEGLLNQVWINLIHNAIKFSPDGGEIHINLAQDERGITCQITDMGMGISEEDRIHIFERFYKADKARDRSAGGNGLGLSLVKKILDVHNSEIFVESQLGSGTTFTVIFNEEEVS